MAAMTRSTTNRIPRTSIPLSPAISPHARVISGEHSTPTGAITVTIFYFTHEGRLAFHMNFGPKLALAQQVPTGPEWETILEKSGILVNNGTSYSLGTCGQAKTTRQFEASQICSKLNDYAHAKMQASDSELPLQIMVFSHEVQPDTTPLRMEPFAFWALKSSDVLGALPDRLYSLKSLHPDHFDNRQLCLATHAGQILANSFHQVHTPNAEKYRFPLLNSHQRRKHPPFLVNCDLTTLSYSHSIHTQS